MRSIEDRSILDKGKRAHSSSRQEGKSTKHKKAVSERGSSIRKVTGNHTTGGSQHSACGGWGNRIVDGKVNFCVVYCIVFVACCFFSERKA